MRVILIGLVVAAVTGGVAFLLLPSSSLSVSLPELSGENAAAKTDATYTDEDAGGGVKKFTDKQYGFSLVHPADLKASKKEEGPGASTITFENDSTAQGFQIFVTPFEGTQITDARFKLDEPSGVRDNLQNVTIDGVSGASFYGKDAQLGDTAEVWFIRYGFLYEITALKVDAEWLSTIMATWKFK